MRLPNGYGCITKLNDHPRRKPYTVRVKGKYIGYAATYQEALEILTEYHKNPKESSTLTYADVFALWKENKAPYLSKRTAYEYEKKFNNYCKPLHDRVYKDLRPVDYYAILNSLDVSNDTKNNLIKLFRAIDKCAYEMEVVDKRYTDSVSYYSKNDSANRVPFTEEEIKLLWDHVNEEDVDIVLILLYTGIRPGELELLKIKDIDFKSGFFKCGIKTKAGKNRLVPIHPKIEGLLKERIKAAKKDTLLNYSAKQLRIRFKKVMERLNLKHIPYECRHTFVTRLDNAGANRVCIDLIVGHQSREVGERVYTHKTEEQLTQTVKLLT